MDQSVVRIFVAWGRWPWSQVVMWNLPSSARSCGPSDRGRSCHHFNTWDSGARLHLRPSFFGLTFNFLPQLGILRVVFQRLLALVVVGRGHAASKTQKNFLTETGQNKNTMKTRYTDLGGPGDYIAKTFTTKGRYRAKPRWRQALRRPHPRVAWPGVGPCHHDLWDPRAPSPISFHLVIFHI